MEQEGRDLAQQREAFEQAAAQAALDKRNAQRTLLETAQAHAELQQKAAAATEAMAAARANLLALETANHEQQVAALAAAQQAVGVRSEEAQYRAVSEDMARKVLGKFTQSSSAGQAIVRLNDILQDDRTK